MDLVKQKAYMCSRKQNVTPNADNKIVGHYMVIWKRRTSEFPMHMYSTTQSVQGKPPPSYKRAGKKLAYYQ